METHEQKWGTCNSCKKRVFCLTCHHCDRPRLSDGHYCHVKCCSVCGEHFGTCVVPNNVCDDCVKKGHEDKAPFGRYMNCEMIWPKFNFSKIYISPEAMEDIKNWGATEPEYYI